MTWWAPQTQASGDHAGEHIWVYNAAVFFIPWCLVAAILAFIWLRDVPVKANIKQQLDIFSNPNTWYMTILYVMTFGLFSGFSAVFGLLINNQFGRESSLALPVLGATFAFLGPLIGSIIRMSWGIFCDRMGGAIWTFISGVGMAITLAGIAWVLYNPTGWTDFYIFMALMLTMFLFSGFGNAGTFKQMPMIMPARQAGGFSCGLSPAPQAAGASAGLSSAPQEAGFSLGLSPAPQAAPQPLAVLSSSHPERFDNAMIVLLIEIQQAPLPSVISIIFKDVTSRKYAQFCNLRYFKVSITKETLL